MIRCYTLLSRVEYYINYIKSYYCHEGVVAAWEDAAGAARAE